MGKPQERAIMAQNIINLRETVASLFLRNPQMEDRKVIQGVRRAVYEAGGKSEDIPRVHEICALAEEIRLNVPKAPENGNGNGAAETKAETKEEKRETDSRFDNFVKAAKKALRAGEQAGLLPDALVEAFPEFKGMSFGSRRAALRKAESQIQSEDYRLERAKDIVRKHMELGGEVSTNLSKFASLVFEGPAKPEFTHGLLTVACARVLDGGLRKEIQDRQRAEAEAAAERIRRNQASNKPKGQAAGTNQGLSRFIRGEKTVGSAEPGENGEVVFDSPAKPNRRERDRDRTKQEKSLGTRGKTAPEGWGRGMKKEKRGNKGNQRHALK